MYLLSLCIPHLQIQHGLVKDEGNFKFTDDSSISTRLCYPI